MRVMVIIKASQASEAGQLPSEERLTAMGNYNEELVKAGILLDGAGLKPSSAGARVHFSGTERLRTDGPFAETKELIAGFWIWRVQSLEEAIAWVKRCPNPMQDDCDIELRPLFEAEDFGEEFTPELREQEAGVLAASLGLNPPSFQNNSAMSLVGLNRSYTLETRIAIPQQWEQFVSQAQALPNSTTSAMYGVCWNTKPNCDFEYLAGIEYPVGQPLPHDFTTLQIPARRYAVFPHTAHVSALSQTLGLIWKKWAPDCGLKIADSASFERYTSDFNPQTGMGGMEVWVPLEMPAPAATTSPSN